jgi:hypothetical protein
MTGVWTRRSTVRDLFKQRGQAHRTLAGWQNRVQAKVRAVQRAVYERQVPVDKFVDRLRDWLR